MVAMGPKSKAHRLPARKPKKEVPTGYEYESLDAMGDDMYNLPWLPGMELAHTELASDLGISASEDPIAAYGFYQMDPRNITMTTTEGDSRAPVRNTYGSYDPSSDTVRVGNTYQLKELHKAKAQGGISNENFHKMKAHWLQQRAPGSKHEFGHHGIEAIAAGLPEGEGTLARFKGETLSRLNDLKSPDKKTREDAKWWLTRMMGKDWKRKVKRSGLEDLYDRIKGEAQQRLDPSRKKR